MRLITSIGVLLLLASGCNSKSESSVSLKNSPKKTTNIYSASLDEDEDKAMTEVHRAWNRYQVATGKIAQNSQSPAGLTDSQIANLENDLCQRLPAQLKAFLKLHKSGGEFHDGFHINNPDDIHSQWSFYCELIYLNLQHPGLQSPNPNPAEIPDWFESHLIPISSLNADDLLVDSRNGKVLESLDHTTLPMADSIVELLDGLAENYENGNTVGNIGDGDPKKFLDSTLWSVYE